MKLTTVIALLILTVSCTSKLETSKITEQDKNVDSKVESNTIIYSPKLLSNALPSIVNEQSGLIWYQSCFWVNNDSDCDASLYAYDKKGILKKELKVSNCKNIDWEDVTDDQDYFYIGDFGNNYGMRKNLRVLRIAKTKLSNQNTSTTEAEEIPISWADQQQFTARKHAHDYDCEAFVAYQDSLYFFSKNWANHKTRMYAASKQVKSQKLKVKAEFATGFMVTGADISSDGKILALVGYKNYRTYLCLFSAYQGNNFFSGKQLHLDLESLGGAQTEGIVFTNEDSLFICTEETNKAHAIYEVEWKQWADRLE